MVSSFSRFVFCLACPAQTKNRRTLAPSGLLGLLLGGLLINLLSGCVGRVGPEEKQARDHLAEVGAVLRPARSQLKLPSLSANSSLNDYLGFALLKHPSIAAAYDDWRASVEGITLARSLPDPQFTFEADIADTVMTLMPGVMFDLMAPGKRRAMAREASAVSEVAYRNYAAEVLRVAAAVRTAWIEIAYVEEALKLREQSLGALDQSTALDASTFTTSGGMVSLENQVTFLNQTAQLRTTIASLEDRRTAARRRFKASLGLGPSEPDPAWPQPSLVASALPSEADLWQAVTVANPQLASMGAMVEMAVTAMQVAQKSRTPDFALGAMVDLKADPLMVRPTANLSLPLWKDKIAATIAAAEARREAAAARREVEQLNLAAEFAQMLYMVRESDRMISYIERTALPNFERSIASAEAAYQSGKSGAGMIPQTRLMALGMQLERAEALRVRETSVVNLLIMTAAVLPPNAPLLSDRSSR